MFSQAFVSGQMSTHTSNLQEQVVKPKPRAKEQEDGRAKNMALSTNRRIQRGEVLKRIPQQDRYAKVASKHQAIKPTTPKSKMQSKKKSFFKS